MRERLFFIREKKEHIVIIRRERRTIPGKKKFSLSGNAQKRKKEREEGIEKRLWRIWSV